MEALNKVALVIVLLVAVVSVSPSSQQGSGSGLLGTCVEGALSSTYTNLSLVTGPDGRTQYEVVIIPEICVLGVLGGVCSRGIDMTGRTVDIGCSSILHSPLGYFRGEVTQLPQPYPGDILLQDVVCSDNAQTIDSCTFNRIIDAECTDSTRALAISCRADLFSASGSGDFSSGSGGFSGRPGFGSGTGSGELACMEGQLSSRYVSYNPAILIGTTGLPEYEATIIPELCINGELGGICSRGVGMSTADLGCSSFFQTPVGFFRGNVTDLPDSQSHPERIVAQDITCSENAQSTMDCSFNGMIDTECSNVTRAVAISCRANYSCFGTNDFIPTQVKFVVPVVVEPVYNFTFLPLLCNNGSVGSICTEGFTPDSAHVACRTAGYSLQLNVIGGEVLETTSQYPGQPLIQNVMCSGSEDAFHQCRNSTVLGPNCQLGSNSVELRCYFVLSSVGSGSGVPGSGVPGSGVPASGSGVSTEPGPGSSGIPPPSLIVPSGLNFDAILEPEMGPLGVDPPFIFYGQAMSDIYIHTNGLITFSPCTYCGSVINFTNPTLPPLIAPLWHEALPLQGVVYYRIARDSETLLQSAAYIMAEYEVQFTPTYVVVITWVEVPGLSAGNSTFQLLMASDGIQSYILFAYEPVWVVNNFQVGYSFGDGVSYFTLANGVSGTYVLTSTTNVIRDPTPGRFVYRVDDLSPILRQVPFIPNGPAFGDSSLPRNDDDAVVNVNFTRPFVVNRIEYLSAYIYVDGFITLGDAVFQRPNVFPIVSPPIVAPSATDLSLSSGDIYYRLSTDETLLRAINGFVVDYDANIGDGRSISEALIVSWVNVPLAFATNFTLSFQAILATTGERSYAFFLFGNSSHPGGPLVGVNYGDDIRYYQENTQPGIESRSNINGVAGFFFYRLDERGNETITPPPTETTSPGRTDTFTSEAPVTNDPDVSCNFDRDLRVVRRSTTFEVTNGQPEVWTNIQGVEVCYSGTYNPVCSNFISEADAAAICRTAGTYQTLGVIGSRTEVSMDTSLRYTGRESFTDVNCTSGGTETLLGCSIGQRSPSSCENPTVGARVSCIIQLLTVRFGTGPGEIPIRDNIADFGPDNMDNSLPDGVNQASPPVTLDPPLPFFGVGQTQLFVHTNGFITFQRSCENCSPSPFPTALLPPTIAVLWQNYANIDTQDVFYRLSSDPSEMYIIYSLFRQEFNEVFAPSYAVIVTWRNLPENGTRGPMGSNSFQAVITTDGTESYVILFYNSIDLTTPAEVGFNFGDGQSYYSEASLRDGTSMGIESRSNLGNVEKDGLYIFSLHSLPIGNTDAPLTFQTPQIPTEPLTRGELESTLTMMNDTAVSTISMSPQWLLVPAIFHVVNIMF